MIISSSHHYHELCTPRNKPNFLISRVFSFLGSFTPPTTMCVKEKWVVGHSHRHCSHSCDWGHWLLFLLLNHLTAPQTGPWRLTAHTWLHYVKYACIKRKHIDRCYRVWKLSLTAWLTPKTAIDPLTASWPWLQLWLWWQWEWPPFETWPALRIEIGTKPLRKWLVYLSIRAWFSIPNWIAPRDIATKPTNIFAIVPLLTLLAAMEMQWSMNFSQCQSKTRRRRVHLGEKIDINQWPCSMSQNTETSTQQKHHCEEV